MSPARRAAWRIGHRGAFLMTYGVAWAVYGAGLLGSGATFAQQRGLTVLGDDLDTWAWLWIVGGMVAIVAAFARRDSIGYVGAVIPPLVWGVAYLLAWWPLDEYDRGWISAGPWTALAVAAVIVARIPEPIRREVADGT
ncbi:hypothetical protein ACIBSV_46680 [Embleya sp. NPDC050154]|uniref:hypothetical protein n=1 Tax=Embleya sp. NPDC050154 TaxID=3363988 RepID=UPI0037A99A9C